MRCVCVKVDSLNEEVARFKAVSRVSDQDGQLKDALEKQIEEHRELHHKQVRIKQKNVTYLSDLTCWKNMLKKDP